MKLISLNLWGGRIYEHLEIFLKKHSKEIDIFCFQEIYNNAKDPMTDEVRKPRFNLFTDLQQALPEHKGFFRPIIDRVYGIGIFVKKDIPVLKEGEIIIHSNIDYPGHGGNHSRNLQWMKLKLNGKVYSILNMHGLWNVMGKTDTDARISQSQKVKEFMSKTSNPKILCGDFNLEPSTKSLEILEEGMINLIKVHEIKNTRSWTYYPIDKKPVRHADYILVSPDVNIKKFEIPEVDVSDHLPLILEFE